MTATIATTARASVRTWNVKEFRDELRVLTSGAVRVMEVNSLDEARYFAWGLAMSILWTLPVAPLYFVRGGLSEIVEDAATKAWYRWHGPEERRMFNINSLRSGVWDYQVETMLWRGEITDYEVLYSVVWDVLFRGYQNVEVSTIRKLPDGLSDLAETLAHLGTCPPQSRGLSRGGGFTSSRPPVPSERSRGLRGRVAPFLRG